MSQQKRVRRKRPPGTKWKEDKGARNLEANNVSPEDCSLEYKLFTSLVLGYLYVSIVSRLSIVVGLSGVLNYDHGYFLNV